MSNELLWTKKQSNKFNFSLNWSEHLWCRCRSLEAPRVGLGEWNVSHAKWDVNNWMISQVNECFSSKDKTALEIPIQSTRAGFKLPRIPFKLLRILHVKASKTELSFAKSSNKVPSPTATHSTSFQMRKGKYKRSSIIIKNCASGNRIEIRMLLNGRAREKWRNVAA